MLLPHSTFFPQIYDHIVHFPHGCLFLPTRLCYSRLTFIRAGHIHSSSLDIHQDILSPVQVHFNQSYSIITVFCQWNTYSSQVAPPQPLPSCLLSSWYVAIGRCDLWPAESEPTADLSREFQAAIPTGHECSRLWQTGMIRVARQHVPNRHAAKSCSTIQGHTRKRLRSQIQSANLSQ